MTWPWSKRTTTEVASGIVAEIADLQAKQAEVGAFLWEKLVELDELLAAKGWARMSPFWAKTIRRWLLSGKLDLVARVGRRGGKGVESAKLAILFARWCPILNLTPGEAAYVELLSVDKEEAGGRLRMIASGFEALGESVQPLAESIEYVRADGTRVVIRVRAASVRAVGGTAILIVEDEMALWRDSATGANPAREIDAQIGAELASQPFGRRCRFSAPFGENDFHAAKFDEGETDQQCVAYAPTWSANPTITEAQTKALEPNPIVWARAYLAQPAAAVTSICGKEDLAACTKGNLSAIPRILGAAYLGTLDPGLKNDAWVAAVWCLMTRLRADGGVDYVLTQVAILRLAPTFLKKVDLGDAIRQTLALFRPYGVIEAHSDDHYSGAIGPRFAEAGVKLVVLPMTSAAITARIENLQLRIQERTIALLHHEEQEREVLAAQLVVHPGGRKTLRAPERRGCHDDHVSTILLACDGAAVARLPAADGADVRIDHAVVRNPFTGDDTPARYRPVLNADGAEVGRQWLPPAKGSLMWTRWASGLLARGQRSHDAREWALQVLALPPEHALTEDDVARALRLRPPPRE